MGLFSILKTAPTVTPKEQTTIIQLGCTEREFRDYYAGKKISIDDTKSSEDFTLDEDVREYFEKREALFPLVLEIIPVHLWEHAGMLTGRFTADNMLGSCEWYGMNWDLVGSETVDTPMTMATVNKIVSEMNEKYGKTTKETDGNTFLWLWTKENINYSLRVTWFEEGNEDNSVLFKEEYMIAETA